MSDEIAERLREYRKEALTAADNAAEALTALEDGDPEKAREIVAMTHGLDGFRKGILDAFAGEKPAPVPWMAEPKEPPRFTRDS